MVDTAVSSYELVLASRTGGPVTSDTGIVLETCSLKQAAARPIDTLLVAGGLGVFDAVSDNKLVAWLRVQAPQARRVGSTCMGTFLSGAAGWLHGRRAVTHWRWCDALQDRYPEAIVERDPIFLRDGPVWSSAGVTAGIDLALAMVEEDHGHEAALSVAQRLVVYLKRPGGQAQFSAALIAQSGDRTGSFDALHAWIADNLQVDLRVERLAEYAGMSPRNFARVYAARIGQTPAETVEAMRVESARRMLESDHATIKAIAGRCGFGDYERMRRAFLRRIGVSPNDYRNRFSAGYTA
ncbi:GlxA family transcriptional regulator [Hypericibacter sp.]|uniref:GlxA family transcriptional regulator n=1 Tax=Hypericibacter sp. TaxID=2705401 RepID=UPI003D6D8042